MELPAFIDRVPDYEVRKGRMHITMGNFELVMPLSVFIEGAIKAEGEIAKWHIKQCDVPKAKVLSLDCGKR